MILFKGNRVQLYDSRHEYPPGIDVDIEYLSVVGITLDGHIGQWAFFAEDATRLGVAARFVASNSERVIICEEGEPDDTA